jgi:hypothetical protein
MGELTPHRASTILHRCVVVLVAVAISVLVTACGSGGDDEPEPDSGTWDKVVELYEQAREAGETGSKDAYEWAREDFHSIGDWQYRVVELSMASAEPLEDALNELGEERWECIWIESRDGNTTLAIFKRRARTYLNRVPMGDLLKLVPKGEGDPGDPE